ncbi:hypothetical protein M9H77_17833 [Catharanthus roseus]|uniref:Uncharacterized protein n=1 Tax=Catharanthus roseus TaxID=4058 RepID=A0ACC0B5R5_CATRO|nr:hypothetical protein M9H77_17833 [Catharanthus roseus]
MPYGSSYFPEGCVRRGLSARIAQRGLVVPRGTQVPYSAAVDLAEGYGILKILQDLLSWIQELKTLILDFDLQLGDSRHNLRRHSEFLIPASRIQSYAFFYFSCY